MSTPLCLSPASTAPAQRLGLHQRHQDPSLHHPLTFPLAVCEMSVKVRAPGLVHFVGLLSLLVFADLAGFAGGPAAAAAAEPGAADDEAAADEAAAGEAAAGEAAAAAAEAGDPNGAEAVAAARCWQQEPAEAALVLEKCCSLCLLLPLEALLAPQTVPAAAVLAFLHADIKLSR